MATTNPFRRRGPTAAIEAPAIPQAASPAAFLESITSTPDSDDPRDGRPTKIKVVKRVRVQSPPPLSPDSPFAARFRRHGAWDDEDASNDDDDDNGADPFEQRFPANPDTLAAMPEAAPLVAANQGLANPFGRATVDSEDTEQDREAAVTAPSSGRAALDVGAFSRLLLTGQSGRETTASPQGAAAAAAAAARPQQPALLGGGDVSTETSSISKQSFSDGPYDTTPPPALVAEITPRTSHEATDQERDEARSHTSEQHAHAHKKAPPPPSTRRGRPIKPQPKEDAAAAAASSPASPPPRSPSDVNKPLPPAPRAHDTDDEMEDVFAREAAGKTPERPNLPRPPEAAGSGKKPTPAPPPRRGHARSESKLAGNANTHASSASHDEETPPRSSLESQHSRLEASGPRHAPAPPPPRRPGVSHRLSSQFGSALTSPTSPPISEAEMSPLGFPTEHANASVDTFGDDHSTSTHPRIAPPPPPPARNPSTRRPNPRGPGAENARRSLGAREKENASAAAAAVAPPPPPPPRQRGSSKGSMDGPGPTSRTSFDSVRVFTPPGPAAHGSGIPEEFVEGGKGADILADLDALQREVDALRGRYGNA